MGHAIGSSSKSGAAARTWGLDLVCILVREGPDSQGEGPELITWVYHDIDTGPGLPDASLWGHLAGQAI